MDARGYGTLVLGQVARYDADTGKYFVKFAGMSGDPALGLPATLLSPIPFTDGGGVKAVAKTPVDTPCLIFNAGTKWVILGFVTPSGLVVNDTHYPSPVITPGELFISHNTGARIGFRSTGAWIAWVGDWVNMTLNPLKKQMTAYFKNLMINLYAGFINYKYDDTTKRSTFTAQISKELELASLTPGEIQKDRVSLTAGQLDDDHVLEITAKQEFDITKLPKFLGRILFGKQKDDTFVQLSGTYDKLISTEARIATTGKLSYVSKNKKDENSIKIESDPLGAPLHLTLNKDRAEVLIDKDGNVTITTAPDAKIKLGGTGREQELVTKSFVEKFYNNHVHSNGNNGSPTGVPLFPTVQTAGADSASSPYTHTTLAE